jgi:putative endonuclease
MAGRGMTHERKRLGRFGEDEAWAFLAAQGYRLLERNFRTRFGELDLIAWHRDVLVFIEVRTRSAGPFGGPIDTVDHEKQRRLRRMAQVFLQAYNIDPETACRFDVIGVNCHRDGSMVIEHCLDAFQD